MSGHSPDHYKGETSPSTKPRVYTAEEIDIFLQGERREVDRLLLHGLNTLASTLIPHAAREESMLNLIEQLGGPEEILERSAFVKQLIVKSEARSAMMRKVAESTVVWALLAFLGFLATAAFGYVIDYLKTKIGSG